MKNPTTSERTSERELVVTRTFKAPPRVVFDAWTKPDLFKRWWAPKSFPISMVGCEMDVRVGGGYRLTFVANADPSKPMDFFGKYLEVVPATRLVWTNDESDAGVITTVTLEEKDGKTLLVMHDRYPSKEATRPSPPAAAAGRRRRSSNSTRCSSPRARRLPDLVLGDSEV